MTPALPPSLPVAIAPLAAIPGTALLFDQPATQYPSVPPALVDMRPEAADRACWFLSTLARPAVACPAESVLRLPNALLLDGAFVLSAERVGVQESFRDLPATPANLARLAAQMVQIAAGDVPTLPAGGAPAVAVFKEGSSNFGHVVAEMLPRLVHLRDMGLREVRLLVPSHVRSMAPLLAIALRALGMAGETVECPAGSVLRVPELLWVSPVAEHNHRKSPTLLRLFAALRGVLRPPAGPRRLYVPRPATASRPIANAAEVSAILHAAGFAEVEPSRLPIAEQLALFAGAHTVLGPMGAALTLTGMMAPGGHVAMLEAANCDFFFWDLACLAGLGFDWAFTAPLGPWHDSMQERPMRVDPRLLRRLVATLPAA